MSNLIEFQLELYNRIHNTQNIFKDMFDAYYECVQDVTDLDVINEMQKITENMFISFVNGDICDNDVDCYDMILNSLHTIDDKYYDVLNTFLNDISKKIEKNDIDDDISIFENTIKKLNQKIINIGIGDDIVVYNTVKKLWGLDGFKKYILIAEKNKKNKKNDKMEWIFPYSVHLRLSISPVVFNKLCCAYEPLYTDKSIHKYIINFMMMTTKLNDMSIFNALFIFSFVMKMYEQYDYNDIENSINNTDDINILLKNKIFTFAIEMMLHFISYFNIQCKIMDISSQLHIISCIVLHNETIEKIFTNYFKVYDKLKFEMNDMINVFVQHEKFMCTHILNYELSSNIATLISSIFGNENDKFPCALHRYSMFTIIINVFRKTGYDIFPNFLANLFDFINTVNINKLTLSIDEAILDRSDLALLLYESITHYNEIPEKTKYIFPETIFKVIDGSIETIDAFSNLNENISQNIGILPNAAQLFKSSIQYYMHVIQLYKFIFYDKLLSPLYPEINEKFVIFIFAILKESYNKNIFSFKYTTPLHKELLEICFDFLCEKIDPMIDIVTDNKNILISCLSFNNITKYQLLIDKIMEYEKQLSTMDLSSMQDFCCPITCKLIKNPIMIPGCNEILERSSIIMQIYSQGLNPYTREKINLAIIEEYNAQEHIKQKIMEFEQRKHIT